MKNKADKTEAMDTETSKELEFSNPTIFQSMARAMIGLGLFAIITAGLIAITQVSTAERIEAQIKQARSKALLEIVPLTKHNNDMLADAFWLDAIKELGLSNPQEAFIAKQDGVPVTLILPVVAPEGYSGPIRLIVGIDVNGDIRGVRVIEHKETPGLGDKISLKKSDWVLGFDGKSLSNTTEEGWRVKKDGGDFDQLTGATITPRAIVKAVHLALQYYSHQQADLLSSLSVNEQLENSTSLEKQ